MLSSPHCAVHADAIGAPSGSLIASSDAAFQDDAESLKIGSAGRGRTLDQPRQLERRLPQKNTRAAKTVPAALISGVRILAGSK
jgi:hypothetical protein